MSNTKDTARSDDFKRATAGALRAMAQVAEVQVAFQPGPSGLVGKRARLPMPTRALPPAEMAKMRGAADSLALRLRHHDDAVHAARSPGRREAKDVYDALEQARVEVVGAEHMAGVAANLRSRLTEECEAEGYDRMVRPRPAPARGGAGAAGAREDVGRGVAGAGRSRSSNNGGTRSARVPRRRWPRCRAPSTTRTLFARAATKAAGGARSGRGGDRCRAGRTRPKRARKAASSPARRTIRRKARASSRARPTACSVRSPSRCRARLPRRTAPRAPRTTPPPRATTARAARSRGASGPAPDSEAGYRAYVRAVRRGDRRRGSVRRATNCRACASSSTSSCSICRAWSPSWPTGCSAGCWRSRPGPGISTSRKGMLDVGRLARVIVNPMLSLSYKRERETEFRDTVVTLLIDNSGSHARPADHRRGDVRRHPGAHAGALRGQGRDPRLHHPRLEGRPEPRALGAGRQAAQSRPAQRSAPHHLQIRRRALAPGAQESRADAARGAAEGEYRRRGAALGVSPPAGAARASPHPDGDQRRRAGRRQHAVGQSRQLPGTASARGDPRDRAVAIWSS